jgi:hypothetical protein
MDCHMIFGPVFWPLWMYLGQNVESETPRQEPFRGGGGAGGLSATGVRRGGCTTSVEAQPRQIVPTHLFLDL